MRILTLVLLFLITQTADLKAQNEQLYSDSISVYFFLGEDCRICQYYSIEFSYLFDHYASDQVQFIGLFPNRYSSRDGINNFKTKYKIPFQLKREYFQTKTKTFRVEVTPEVVVYDEKRETILYRGRIDDSYYRVGRRKRVIQKRELRDALNSIQNNALILKKETNPIGCFITFEDDQ